jgi:uncharacterized membrane protein HdeD (DUF308 family)
MSTLHALRNDLSSEIKSRAGWGIFLGLVTAALGLLLLAYPLAAATVTTVVLGCVLVVAGAIDIVLALSSHTAGSFFLRLLLGIGYGLAGVLMVTFPLWGVAVLTVVVGTVLFFEAAMAAMLAFQTRPNPGWGWLLFDAGVTALLGILILAHWPQSAIWAIGTLVGAAVLIRGITRIALSFGLRRMVSRVTDRDVQRPRAA